MILLYVCVCMCVKQSARGHSALYTHNYFFLSQNNPEKKDDLTGISHVHHYVYLLLHEVLHYCMKYLQNSSEIIVTAWPKCQRTLQK